MFTNLSLRPLASFASLQWLLKAHRKDAKSAKGREGHRTYHDLKILSLCHRRKSALGRSTKLRGKTAREFPWNL